MSQAWTQKVLACCLNECEFVEIVVLIASIIIMDTTPMALGVDDIDLPDAVAGEPTRYSPPGAIVQAAWPPIVEPEDVVETDQPLYPSPRIAKTRNAVMAALGNDATVDATATASAFHGFVRIADIIGIPYDGAAQGPDVPEIREEAGINDFYRTKETD